MSRSTLPPPRTEPSPAPARPRLLLVDDDDLLLRTLQRMLQARYEIVSATDGTRASELLTTESFDVVLTDVGLPGASGVDLLRLVRAYDLDVPVLLMTGSPEIDSVIEALDLGALTYIRKPFERDILERALGRATVRASGSVSSSRSTRSGWPTSRSWRRARAVRSRTRRSCGRASRA